jgi:CubicO group peptidase (beta-lactamase class C family)
VDSFPDEAGTTIRDEDGGEASVSSERRLVFFIRAGPGEGTVFFHPAATGDEDTAGHIRRVLDRYAGYGFSGVVTVSEAEGASPVTVAAGQRAGPGSQLMDSATIFELGSLTKHLTAAAVLELEDRGLVSVRDPLSRWHPELPAGTGAITLHQLLIHTSGLPEDVDVSADDVPAVWRTLAGVELEHPPGEEWGYSNLGYVVLAALVDEMASEGYRRLVGELIRRSGVKDMGFPGSHTEWSERYSVGGSGPLGTGRLTDRWPIVPAGWNERLGASGVVATMPALHDWFRALRSGRVLSAAATERMFEERPPEIAYGWFYLHDDDGSVRIAHGGDTRGFQTYLAYDPTEDVVVALGINDRRGWRAPLLRDLELLVGQDSLPELPPPVVEARTSLYDLAGVYELADGSSIEVDTAGDRLRLAASGPAAIAMLTGSGRALADTLAEASRRSGVFLARILEADTAALKETLAESGRPDSFWEIWSHLTAGHAGPPVEARVLGTIPERAGRVVSFVRVCFDDGEEILRLVWRPHLDGWGTGGDLPTRDFWPADDGRLVSFDPTRPGWVEFRVERRGDRRELLDAAGRRASLVEAESSRDADAGCASPP